MEQAGAVISGLWNRVNGIESVDYFSGNYDAAYQEALEKAVDFAPDKRQKTIAQAGGKTYPYPPC